MNIKPVKGRAMLTWVGKHRIEKVNYYPAQLEEVCNVDNPASEPTYENFQSGPNLVFQGDNKEILSTLLVNGFGGKIDLIYIDPPFASGADYVRKVALRGKKEKLEAEGHSVAEQMQYTDIWANDTYLQFMYERLILMRQLLSENGSIYLHCDPTMGYYLRVLMDEVFDKNHFRNEIIWFYHDSPGRPDSYFPQKHDIIIWYSKDSTDWIFNSDDVRVPILEASKERYKSERVIGGKGYVGGDSANEGKIPEDVWSIPIVKKNSKEGLEGSDYPTQKPRRLVKRIIMASSNEGSIVLDCFVGSGTTPVVAEKLGRRWIAADLNKGAIQTTIKRIQTVIDVPRGIAHYRVNNYDASTHLERKYIVIKKCGVQTDRQERFFDGTLDGTLVRIVDLTKPLTRLDIQHIKDELRTCLKSHLIRFRIK